ncbi:hypothetical protein CEXT_414321 [Caerostris extrusa]|uniref:Uncharacterized protein n=1 Tax=Caerostris extrusa TaxID=172846 RepID=A0AAV4QNY5_CAEEX|nr:hypothetical protein CEXT_414321 [Caerostris extrusa]
MTVSRHYKRLIVVMAKVLDICNKMSINFSRAVTLTFNTLSLSVINYLDSSLQHTRAYVTGHMQLRDIGTISTCKIVCCLTGDNFILMDEDSIIKLGLWLSALRLVEQMS